MYNRLMITIEKVMAQIHSGPVMWKLIRKGLMCRPYDTKYLGEQGWRRTPEEAVEESIRFNKIEVV